MLVIQNILRKLPKINTLTIAKYIFLLTPLVVILFKFFFVENINLESLLQDTKTIIMFIILMTFPFCYLLLNRITGCEDSKNIILGLSLISFVYGNIVCAFLLAFNIISTDGKNIFTLKKINLSKYKLEYGILAFLLLIAFLITIIRFRLNGGILCLVY